MCILSPRHFGDQKLLLKCTSAENHQMPPTNMEKLDVIGQYRFYLSILKAFNADDSHHCESWRAWLERRTTFLYTTVFFAGESLCTMLGIWGLCDHELVLREAASVAPVIITNLQVLPSYISLAWQNRKISRVLDGAQALINARKSIIKSRVKCVARNWTKLCRNWTKNVRKCLSTDHFHPNRL